LCSEPVFTDSLGDMNHQRPALFGGIVAPAESLDSRPPITDHVETCTDRVQPTLKRPCSFLEDSSLIRGVSIQRGLSSFGKSFHTSTGTLKVQATDYAHSEEVSSLNAFISHNWASIRASKTAALLMVYNLRAAVTASVLVGSLLPVLQSRAVSMLPRIDPFEVMVADQTVQAPYGIWAAVCCPITFLG